MPDGIGGINTDKRSKIIHACETQYPHNRRNCSGFVKAVCRDIGVILHPQATANQIYDVIKTIPWQVIGIGNAAASVAGVMAATSGRLVVGAKKSNPNGHVAIIVDFASSHSSPARGKSIAYWGRLSEAHPELEGKIYSKVSLSWTSLDLEQVLFSYLSI